MERERERRERERERERERVGWCFEPSQPQRRTDRERISTLKMVVQSDIGLYLNVKTMKSNFRQNVLAYMLQSSVNSKQAS